MPTTQALNGERGERNQDISTKKKGENKNRLRGLFDINKRNRILIDGVKKEYQQKLRRPTPAGKTRGG